MFPEGIARITFDFSVEINLHIFPNILQCFSYYSEQHKMRRVLIFFFSSFKKQKHRECFIFYVIFLHFFSFVNTNYRQLNCFPYLNKTLIIIFFFRFNHICLHCRLISIFPLHWNEKSQSFLRG